MKVSLEILNSYLSKQATLEDTVAALERTELEVEEIIHPHILDKNIVTAKVVRVQPHPDADRLRVATVEVRKGVTEQVVCGAPNLAKGQVVALAQLGSKLPDGTSIKKAKIRGVESRGMLCSPAELGWSDDHSGIAVLDPDLPYGISLCDIDNNQTIIDLKPPTNRPDMFSFVGIAREVAANLSFSCTLLEPKSQDLVFANNKNWVEVADESACKRIVTLRFKVKPNSLSPEWLVDNLRAAGMRPINTVVDITNYVMLETGQPTHAYDANKLQGNIGVRFAKPSESLTTLDGANRTLSKQDLVIVDKSGVIGLAGVMGGQSTETSVDTQEIVVEIANFDKTIIRKSAQRHGLRTEASTRFEKGLPLPLPIYAANRIAYLLSSICHAEIIDSPIDQCYAWPWVQHVGLRMRKTERFLGITLDEKQVIDGLRSRGFEAEHFSITKEARKHLGKPYKWGANYKQDRADAFDCSYFVDYIYSLIGEMVGHQCLELFESGQPVDVHDLRPGDVVFRDGPWEKLDREARKGISHAAIYIGNGKIIHAADTYRAKNGEWKKYPSAKQMVIEESVETITKDPAYQGARRYVENFNHIVAITAPWWRQDIRGEYDLYEEVAKIIGYEKLSASLPQLPPTDTHAHQMLPNIQSLKELLVAQGLFEVMTYSFVSQDLLKFSRQALDKHFAILNPMSVEQAYLRSSLMMSHLQILTNNTDYFDKAYGYFEIAKVYEKANSKAKKQEQWQLGITVVGNGSVQYMRNILETVSKYYQWQVVYKPSTEIGFIANRYASMTVQDKQIGGLGQLSSILLKKIGKLPTDVSYTQINLSPDLIARQNQKVHNVAHYQYVSRDITVLVDEVVWWQELVEVLKHIPSIYRYRFMGEYQNEQHKSTSQKTLSFRIWLDCGAQPSSQAINEQVELVTKTLKKELLHLDVV